MTDKMTPIRFQSLINKIFDEYRLNNSIFGIEDRNFFRKTGTGTLTMFGKNFESPIGPAAGPHTQLAQNLIASYLTGGRFFELKTVQQMDELEIDKPCIDAQDEAYNVEWSQELKLEESFDEYLKAWLLIPIINKVFGLSNLDSNNFIFNMSVGYNLEGIKTERMDKFIESLKNAAKSPAFNHYKDLLLANIYSGTILQFLLSTNSTVKPKELIKIVENISNVISDSVTLSTMHGCPPQEIEAIAKYMIFEKKINTYVKLNPTLLGFDTVRNLLDNTGFDDIIIKPESFEHDLQFEDAIPMLLRLKAFALENNVEFGIKLSNTLGVENNKERLPGKEMYMSGRALFPLTINLSKKLANALEGDISISYSGGATVENVEDIFNCGIFPITIATELLKPGGYARFRAMSEKFNNASFNKVRKETKIDLELLNKVADSAVYNKNYKKESREIETVKVNSKLPLTDCFIAPCSVACPIHQDIAEYIRLIEEGRFPEAYEVIVSKNPLPQITGHICDHECMDKCTRWDYDEPVHIRELKKIAAEKGSKTYLEKFEVEYSIKSNGIKCAVIGAGPAGLSAAYFLVKAGFDVTVFEKYSKAGGVVEEIIPEFRIPSDAINSDIDFIKKHGVKFVFNSQSDVDINALKSEGYKYIFLGIGAPKANELEMSTDSDKVLDALEFLKAFNEKHLPVVGETIAVIGGGNTAMDAARAAKRVAGVKNVYIVYRRTKEFMPADKEEIVEALEEGCILTELVLPISFNNGKLVCAKMVLGEKDSSGRRSVTQSADTLTLDIDFVIPAIGESVDVNLLTSNGIALNNRGKIVITNAGNETSVENVFVGGDALRGPSSIVKAIADGKLTAEVIIKKENQTSIKLSLFNTTIAEKEQQEALNARKTSLIHRDETLASTEASRCLNCNYLCNKCVEVCPNRANMIYKPSFGNFKDVNQIVHLHALCNECGNCATFCPHSGAPYKEKITLFSNQAEIKALNNEGFCFETINGIETLLIKTDGNIKEIALIEINSVENLNEKEELIKNSALDIQKNLNYLLQI